MDPERTLNGAQTDPEWIPNGAPRDPDWKWPEPNPRKCADARSISDVFQIPEMAHILKVVLKELGGRIAGKTLIEGLTSN